ncbi:MAG: hypothetical protein ABSD13_14475 [Candidatus Korobacteraceae bacterium]
MSDASFAKDTSQQYEIVNPESVVKIAPMDVNSHPSTLEGKTVVLRANEKHNADNVLEKVAELLTEKVKEIKIIKAWEVLPETRDNSQGPERSKQFAQKLAALKPDLVIGSQGD